MGNFFSIDSKPMQAMSRLYDLVVLNLLFIITSLPIITLGAASTALYDVCFRMGTDREEGVLRPYFRAFGRNFWQSTGLWLILGTVSGLCLTAIALLLPQPGWMGKAAYLWMVTLAVSAFVYSYAYPLQSQFANRLGRTLKNAALLSVAFLPRTLVLCALNCLPLALAFFAPELMVRTGYLWVFVYFSAAAFLNSRILGKVFAPFQEEQPQ